MGNAPDLPDRGPIDSSPDPASTLETALLQARDLFATFDAACDALNEREARRRNSPALQAQRRCLHAVEAWYTTAPRAVVSTLRDDGTLTPSDVLLFAARAARPDLLQLALDQGASAYEVLDEPNALACDSCLDLLLAHCSADRLNSVPFASDGHAQWEDVGSLGKRPDGLNRLVTTVLPRLAKAGAHVLRVWAWARDADAHHPEDTVRRWNPPIGEAVLRYHRALEREALLSALPDVPPPPLKRTRL